MAKTVKGSKDAAPPLVIGLGDPGMTPLLRAGLGGLAASLRAISRSSRSPATRVRAQAGTTTERAAPRPLQTSELKLPGKGTSIMSLHVFGAIVTANGTAANNRGLTEGNITTLQKLVWKGHVHTTVSAEAIRFALRRRLAEVEDCNRTYNDEICANTWADPKWLLAT